MAQRGVNKCIIVGNLGQEPETRYMPSGKAVTTISVATSEEWKNKETGQKESRTEWHRISFFGKLAEIAGEYLKKGTKVYVEGQLRTRKWQAQDGSDRYTTEIVANEMQMLDSRGGNDGQAPAQRSQAAQAMQDDYGPGVTPSPERSADKAPSPAMSDFEDDIPFLQHERFTVA